MYFRKMKTNINQQAESSFIGNSNDNFEEMKANQIACEFEYYL